MNFIILFYILLLDAGILYIVGRISYDNGYQSGKWDGHKDGEALILLKVEQNAIGGYEIRKVA